MGYWRVLLRCLTNERFVYVTLSEHVLHDLSTASFDWLYAVEYANDSLSPAPVCLTAGKHASYVSLPWTKDAEPSGRDNKLCSQPNSLRETFEEPHTSITLRSRRKTSSSRESDVGCFASLGPSWWRKEEAVKLEYPLTDAFKSFKWSMWVSIYIRVESYRSGNKIIWS